VPLLKPDIPGWIKPPLKVHLRKENGFSACGLMSLDGETTEEPANVTCERCLAMIKPPTQFLSGEK
jgi:hypothetical protein